MPEVLRLHTMSLERYGGLAGLRDPGALEAAVEQPKNTYFYGRGDLFDIAAAYAFHIAQAQACIDGNKRTAVAAALMFLKVNRITTHYDQWEIHRHMLAIAERRSGKVELAALLRVAAAEGQ
jgi:death-on-curing protein